MPLAIRWLPKDLPYEGSALSPLWAYRTLGIQGPSAVAFAGPCRVPLEGLVDQEDVRRKAPIASPRMLHLIAEDFSSDLEGAVWRQRLLTAIALDLLHAFPKARKVTRDGDDLYEGKAKLSVSIATVTPVSTKIHFGINILSKGTPVKTKGLADYGIPAAPFAKRLLAAYAREWEEVQMARCKVRAYGTSGLL
jgi:hypothetical protein